MAGMGGGVRLDVKHKLKLINEIDLNQILPELVSKGVFTYSEERDIQSCSDQWWKRSEVFVDKLFRKGPEATGEFFRILEQTNPRLLRYFLDTQSDGTNSGSDDQGVPPSPTRQAPSLTTSQPPPLQSGYHAHSPLDPIHRELPRRDPPPSHRDLPHREPSHREVPHREASMREGFYGQPPVKPPREGIYNQPGSPPTRDSNANIWSPPSRQDMKSNPDPHATSGYERARLSPKPSNRDLEKNQVNMYNSVQIGDKSAPSPPAFYKPWERGKPPGSAGPTTGGGGGPGSSHSPDYESLWDDGGERIVWETHHVSLSRVPSYGFGIAVSGGRDNPHFANGDPSIAVSDVLKAGPAEARLQINDRLLSVNGISLENVDHATAISVLKDSGETVNLVVRRKVAVTSSDEFSIQRKVTLTKKNKKDEYGIQLGYKLYIKEITANSLAAQDGILKEGDSIIKINNVGVDSVSMADARKQMEKSKDKLQLVVVSGHKHKSNQPGGDSNDPAQHPGSTSDGPRRPDSGTGDRPNHNSSVERSPQLRPISYAQLDRPSTPPAVKEGIYVPHRPKQPQMNGGVPHPPSPSNAYRSPVDYGYSRPPEETDNVVRRRPHPDETDAGVRRRPHEGSEPRFISFKKDGHGNVGICISGGNRTGIFVHKVAPNTPAEQQGLHEGDVLMKVNDVDMRGKTREEALLMLTSLREQVNLLVQYRREEYDRLMNAGGSGDFFHIRAHFNYADTEHGEISFRHGDIFCVTNTLHSGIVGSWEAIKLGRNNKEVGAGIIPNKSRAEQLSLAQNPDKENAKPNRGGSFFKKKVARRVKSLGKDHWDDVIFGSLGRNASTTSKAANPSSKFPVYERVVLRDAGFVRPVVILGPLADVAIDRLIRDIPDRFESAQTDLRDDNNKGRSTIIRFGAIRQIRDKGRHCVLDVTPNAIDRLNYNQFAPIVIFLRPDTKHSVKELRQRWAKTSRKSPRKLYEQAAKLEKHFSYLFTHTLALTSGDIWYRKLKESILDSQRHPVWMSEMMPSEDTLKDDFLFPMSNRLSYASSPESESETMRPHSMYDDDEDIHPSPTMPRRRMMRSSSDPSIATAENVPGIPPYPAPPRYHRDHPRQQDGGAPHFPNDKRYPPAPPARNSSHNPATHPEEKYYPSYYADSLPRSKHSRSNIDPYATLTPSERLRGQQESGYRPDSMRVPQRSPSAGHLDRDYHHPPMERLKGGGYPRPVDPNIYSYRVEAMPTEFDKRDGKLEDCSLSSDTSYSKYTAHPSNKHDDSKLQEKYQRAAASLERNPSKTGDIYRYTRSTINPYKTATIDKSKLSDLHAKYSQGDVRGNKNHSPNSRAYRGESEPTRSKSEANIYQEGVLRTSAHPNQSSNAPTKSVPNLERAAAEQSHNYRNRQLDEHPYDPYRDDRRREGERPHHYPTQHYPAQSQSQNGYPDHPHSTSLGDRYTNRSGSYPWNRQNDHVPPSSNPGDHASSNALYMDHRELSQSIENTRERTEHRERDMGTYSSRDSGLPNSLERPRTSSQNFESYKKLVTPGFYGAKPSVESSRDRDANSSAGSGDGARPASGSGPDRHSGGGPGPDRHSSAFESYRKPSPSDSQPTTNAAPLSKPEDDSMITQTGDGQQITEESHTVVATARGVFDSNGGVLESKETGVSIIIPKGAIPDGIQQEIYFKVCQDNSILPPLDKDKGETLLSPLVMCGPHGLKFNQPVELRLPHCASVNPDSWAFSLKSSDSPTGGNVGGQWQNMTLAGIDGVSQGRIGKNSVSVLVDHF